VCGAKQISNQTTMNQTIIINQKKLENYESDKEHKLNCLSSSVLMNLLWWRELSVPLSKLFLLDYNEIYMSCKKLELFLISTFFPNFFL
jgi:hypothetical protein